MTVAYRPDVDGLRAVAIIAVVLYHYAVPGFHGGYLGVDVFFVISGFLITSLISGDIERGEFTFIGFYERRIRRIFPALFFMLFVTGVAAFLLLYPRAYFDYAKSVAATAGFLSNFVFFSESGYFRAAADHKPLLHTWSLAVEEQFYLVFPAIMLLISRYAKGRYARVFLILLVASLGLSVLAARSWPSMTFYMLPPRMWELLLGGLVAVGAVPPPRGKTAANGVAVAGLALIAYPVLSYWPAARFPGYAALLPCCGTAAIILAGRAGVPAVNRLLSVPPAVFIGKISYSLYLWHWPLYVFAKFYLDRDLFPWETVLLIAVSAAAAILSWYCIERPFRGPHPILARKPLFAAAGLSIAILIGYGTSGILNDGYPQRYPAEVLALLAPMQEPPPTADCPRYAAVRSSERLCLLGDESANSERFILWGDSHARALMPALNHAAERAQEKGLAAVKPGCPPLIGVDVADHPDRFCQAHNDRVLAFLRASKIDTVILAARWTVYVDPERYGDDDGSNVVLADSQSRTRSPEQNQFVFERGLPRTIKTLREMGYRVAVVGPIPEIGFNVPIELANRRLQGRSEDIGPTTAEFQSRNRTVLALFQQQGMSADFLYPHRLLCQSARCDIIREGKPLYVDDDHLSRFGAENISGIFDPLLEDQAVGPIRAQARTSPNQR